MKMTERPILFSGPMVRALLAGTKTQTRRVVKPVGNDGGFVLIEQESGAWRPYRSDDGETSFVTVRERGKDYLHEIPMSCPYGAPGSKLWVRETWAPHFMYEGVRPADILIDARSCLFYAADGGITGGCSASQRAKNWRPAIHMPRAASRITLEITGVRVERLQDISRGDAMAEGCPFPNMAKGPDPRQWYADLWNEINGPGSWDANPWVWVVAFKRVQGA